MITINQQGRERYCEAKLEKLSEVADWVEDYKKFWETKLDALESYLHQLQSKKNVKIKKKKQSLKKNNHGNIKKKC